MSEIALGEAAPKFRPKRRILGGNHPGSNAPRGRWPLEYKYLIFRVYESLLGPYGAAENRAIADRAPIKQVAERIKFAAPDMYDWWMDNHPDSTCSFEEWVRTTVYNRYFYMYTNVKTREAGISTEHPDNWDCYKKGTAEWQEIVAWVEQRLEFGAPPEVCDV
ncbi:hypothetical protein QTH97_02340 [Variovorax sp. J22R24]|uniref:hypothetical protein n=1 Tax=Variovorax gracilis TaxID=3053502 RepID=UPI0025790DCC|nr:hypothetical protein [Variovorax sp. J22R24]MDM0103756.1 hypothetical protein [Variovorax sp. J22R24]